jgi:DNA ligase-4
VKGQTLLKCSNAELEVRPFFALPILGHSHSNSSQPDYLPSIVVNIHTSLSLGLYIHNTMTITFGAICSLLQSVENITTRHPRLPPKKEKESIQQITMNWFTNQRQGLNDPDTNGGAVLSALFPHRRKDRVYGLQAPLLAKKLTTLLAFNHGQKALFDGWKSGKIGDLGAYTERAMKPWDGTFSSKRAISIDRIDGLLIQLAAKYRFSDKAIRMQRNWYVKTDTELKEIFIRLESWEAKWLVRLILRDHSTIELNEQYVLGQYHFLLPDLLMFQNDFDAVFGMLRAELSIYPSVPDPSRERAMRIEAAQKLQPVVGVKVGRPTFHKAWSFEHCLQLVGQRAWAAEVKYDGEYCEIHIDLDNAPNETKIYSKNGKDATADREPLQTTIRDALRIGRTDCLFKRRCIVLGEMVLYSDRDKRVLPFGRIRKHISRSGSFIGTLQDSLPHEWEHLMIVFFDLLVLDDVPVLRHCLQDRRKMLRDLVHVIPGRSMRSEWTLVDFKTGDGITDLKQVFAWNLANRQEGLVLKPLHAPYFPLLTEQGYRQAGFFIKVKKDYLSDMGGERDLGDFAIIGASFDAQVAPKTDVKPLHWTHFHLGCCINKTAVQRTGAKPKFKVVTTLSLDKCIPKLDVKYLNVQGYVRQTALRKGGVTDAFDIEHSKGFDRRMTVAFKKPFVAEILGGGFEKLQNETFEMLRHPRVKKLHHDRTWEDCVTMEDLERMAEEKWDVPDADKLDGHARDVALLVKRYVKEIGYSQGTSSNCETTQNTTQQTTPRTTQETAMTITPQVPRSRVLPNSAEAMIQETHEQTYTTASTTQDSRDCSTQGKGIQASRNLRVLVREDTSERLAHMTIASPATVCPQAVLSTATNQDIALPTSTADTAPSTAKGRVFTELISPPASKRRKILSPLEDSGRNRSVGAFNFDSQEGTIHIYANEGLKVLIHPRPMEEE